MKNRRKDRPAKGQEYVIGFEYQVLDNEKNPDARRGTNHQAGALYDMISPSKDATRPVGEFNHSRLVVKGDAVEHWLNGVKVVDGSLNAPEVAKGTGARWGTDSQVYELLVKHPKRTARSRYKITRATRGSRILRFGSYRAPQPSTHQLGQQNQRAAVEQQ
jgi:hypothetical protein